jgi:peptidoglycan/LPS O-acetylase OafA/YrhL
MTPQRIAIFDGLRGYCALWVALVHLARMLVLHNKYWFPEADTAVGIFFILSGYVITSLITQQKESYRVFLFRRYCRLAPAFVFFCVLYIIFSGVIISALTKLDTTQHPVYSLLPAYINGARFWYIHLPAHIAMLHGWLEPWVPNSAKAILPEGWSMTVEWQFYLVAPLLVSMVAKQSRIALTLLVTASVFLALWHPWRAVLATDYLVDFLSGMLTCFYLNAPQEKSAQQPLAAAMLVLFAFALFMKQMEILLWCVFVYLAYGARADVQRAWHRVFDNRVSNFLGRISYSVYLCHMLLTFLVIHLVAGHVDPIKAPEQFYFTAMPLIIIGTLAFATLTCYTIELPAMRWSKRVIARYSLSN